MQSHLTPNHFWEFAALADIIAGSRRTNEGFGSCRRF